MITLHEMHHSPYCFPVRRILDSRSVQYQINPIPAWDRRELLQLTGGDYYQVPVIEDGKTLIYETTQDPLAVAHFLDREYCNGELFPAEWSGIHELIISHIEDNLEGAGFILSDPYFTDSIEDPGNRGMVIRHKERSFGRDCVEKWRNNQQALLAEFDSLLEPFAQRLAHAPFLFGDAPVYADFALYGVLENASYGNAVQPAEDLPDLQAWWKRVEEYQAAS